MTPDRQRIDHTSLALGEMREFMTHHRKQMDEVQSSVSELTDAQRKLQHNHEVQMVKIDETRQDVGDIKVSIEALCKHHSDSKISRKSLLKGAGYGLLSGVLFAAVYYGDAEMLKVIYRHTIGILA